MADTDRALREQLVHLLNGGQAHVTVRDALANFPADRAAERPAGLPYSAWQIAEHMRLALEDLLEFATQPEYRERKWPEDYWPKQPAPPSEEAWRQATAAISSLLDQFTKLAQDPNSNLYDTIPWGKHGETLLRELLVAADHTSYHLGEFIVLRRLLGEWNK